MEENKNEEKPKVIELTEHLKKTLALGKTIEEQGLLLQEKEFAIEELKKTILSFKEFNIKLAYSTRLFAEVYYTKDEKIAIAQEIDRAITDEQIKEIYAKHKSQAVTTSDTGNNDYVYSSKFIEDLDKHYFQLKGHNPFESIYVSLQPLQKQIQIEEEMRVALENNDSDKIEEFKSQWESTRADSIKAIGEISATVADNMKK